MIREVRLFLKQHKQENSRWSDSEILSYLNDGIQKYFLVINQVAEGQFDKTTTLDVTNGTETVALPSDFFTLKALYANQNGLNKILVYDNNMTLSYATANLQSSPSLYEPTYYFRGNSLVLRPVPAFTSSNGFLVLEYTAFPDTMLSGSDSMTAGISPLFKELVVMYAVYKCKMTDDSVNGAQTRAAVQAHLADLYNNFKEQVVDRSKYPLKIQAFNPF